MTFNIAQVKTPRVIVMTFFAVTLVLASLAGGRTASANESFADLAEKLLPSVVNISTSQKIEERAMPDLPELPEGSPFQDFFEEFMDRRSKQLPSMPASSLGSGFIIDAEQGFVVTNNHVIRDADEIKITLQDDTVLEVELVGTDDKTDLALLKIKDKKGVKLSASKFGSSDKMRVGDWVVAIGNPFGLGGTVTAGIISARQRDINSGPYDDYLQTDASINRGNSGGPMFNLDGEVIGINTAIYSPTGGSVGIGFAIPSDMAKPILEQLMKYGKTRRGWLGVRIQEVTEDIADSMGMKKAQGALVASVTPSGPAEKAGIKAGDIIIEFNGREIDEMRILPRTVAETEIGKTAPVTVWRDGKEVTLSAEVGELEKAEASGILNDDTISPDGEGPTRGKKIDKLGLVASEITPSLRAQYNIGGDVDGVVVTDVAEGSDALAKGMQAGDVILEINQNKVNTPDRLNGFIDNARRSGRSSVLLLVNRGGNIQFVALRFGQ